MYKHNIIATEYIRKNIIFKVIGRVGIELINNILFLNFPLYKLFIIIIIINKVLTYYYVEWSVYNCAE